MSKFREKFSFATIQFKALILIFGFVLFSFETSAQTPATKSWGGNFNGQLGTGNTTIKVTPQTLNGLTDIVALSGGQAFALALRSNGTVVSWGYNGAGQRGDGTSVNTGCFCNPTPGQVTINAAGDPLTNVVAVSAGTSHSLALKADGTVWAWGDNGFGQIARTDTNGSIPRPSQIGATVTGFTDIVAIEAGAYHNLALKADGSVWAWGNNQNGQIGNNSTVKQSSPLKVNGLPAVIAIAAGNNHSLALGENGRIYIWGGNGTGQLGNGTSGTTNQLTPVLLNNASLTNVVNIAAGGFHNVAQLENGDVYTWGYNVNGQLGNGTVDATGCNCNPTPAKINNFSGVVDIRSNGNHTIARTRDGKHWAWGWSNSGQARGDGTTIESQTTPFEMTALSANEAVFSGGNNSSYVSIPSAPVSNSNPLAIYGENFKITFTSFAAGGNALIKSVVASRVLGVPPPGITKRANSLAYDISLTDGATPQGSIEVCLKVPTVASQSAFNNLRLLHQEGGNLVDVTTSKNYRTRMVCGQTTSLSPFVIGEPGIPTAAEVSLGGRVMLGKDRGVSGAQVRLTNLETGETRLAQTNSFGYYRFLEIPVGNTYLLEVSHKRYEFEQQVFNLTEERTDLDFHAR